MEDNNRSKEISKQLLSKYLSGELTKEEHDEQVSDVKAHNALVLDLLKQTVECEERKNIVPVIHPTRSSDRPQRKKPKRTSTTQRQPPKRKPLQSTTKPTKISIPTVETAGFTGRDPLLRGQIERVARHEAITKVFDIMRSREMRQSCKNSDKRCTSLANRLKKIQKDSSLEVLPTVRFGHPFSSKPLLWESGRVDVDSVKPADLEALPGVKEMCIANGYNIDKEEVAMLIAARKGRILCWLQGIVQHMRSHREWHLLCAAHGSSSDSTTIGTSNPSGGTESKIKKVQNSDEIEAMRLNLRDKLIIRDHLKKCSSCVPPLDLKVMTMDDVLSAFRAHPELQGY
eukprot:TRINITY_DN734974_c0_g1_i1.p1 TRINITY_DN734974_c0_g1~~TRINITY_DN734974_c0_g1_i1.p1  ORF type:complete len:343 (-),score=84.53 TRINITY_DN734974_c0_g1_i1:94-1122(-)